MFVELSHISSIIPKWKLLWRTAIWAIRMCSFYDCQSCIDWITFVHGLPVEKSTGMRVNFLRRQSARLPCGILAHTPNRLSWGRFGMLLQNISFIRFRDDTMQLSSSNSVFNYSHTFWDEAYQHSPRPRGGGFVARQEYPFFIFCACRLKLYWSQTQNLNLNRIDVRPLTW